MYAYLLAQGIVREHLTRQQSSKVSEESPTGQRVTGPSMFKDAERIRGKVKKPCDRSLAVAEN
jgi:hypothetical protein